MIFFLILCAPSVRCWYIVPFILIQFHCGYGNRYPFALSRIILWNFHWLRLAFLFLFLRLVFVVFEQIDYTKLV